MKYETHNGKQYSAQQEAIVDDLFSNNLRKGEKQTTDIPKRHIRLIKSMHTIGIANGYVNSVVDTVLFRYNNSLISPSEKQLSVITSFLSERRQLPILEALYEQQQRIDNRTEAQQEAEEYGNDPLRLAEVILALRAELKKVKADNDVLSNMIEGAEKTARIEAKKKPRSDFYN